MTWAAVDVYPVGALSELQMLGRTIVHRHKIRQMKQGPAIRPALRKCAYQFRRHGHRRNFWNGYLAEPRWGQNPAWQRCGTGWTKQRAVGSLGQQVFRVEVPR